MPPFTFLAPRPRELVFVFSPRSRHVGSTVMRGEQLAEIARGRVRDAVRFASLDEEFRRADLVLTKGALKDLPPERLAAWRAQGCRLLFDPVDEAPPGYAGDLADVILAASLSAFLAFSREFPRNHVAVVNHHVDPRVRALGPPPTHRTFSVGYFGEPFNARLTSEIEQRVDVWPVSTARQDDSWIERLDSYPLHYGVRQKTIALDRHKPFLKGFIAAERGANILIQESEAEAVAWLGADYHYLIRGDATEDAILAALDDARSSFGGPEWLAALEVMAAVRERVHPARIAAELRRALG